MEMKWLIFSPFSLSPFIRKDPESNSIPNQPRPSQDSLSYRDDDTPVEINENVLDTKAESGSNRSASDKDAFRSSLTKAVEVARSTFEPTNDSSIAVQIESDSNRKSYLEALRILFVEDSVANGSS